MARSTSHDIQVERLFACLAEQVKLPFVQVQHAAELMMAGIHTPEQSQQTIQEVSRAAIQLIDGFLLQVRLQQESQLQLESVPVSSVLYDTAELLNPYAKLHGIDIQLDVAGKYGPVMAHALGLRTALANLGYTLIDAAEKGQKQIITLSVRKSVQGISAGVYSNGGVLSSKLLEQARLLQGSVHQPLAGFSSNAAGVFVADGLLQSLGAELRVSRLRGSSGFATTFTPSRQLSLV